ncbi:MAG: FecR domain-containing protein, partial [Nitrospirota bacterium]
TVLALARLAFAQELGAVRVTLAEGPVELYSEGLGEWVPVERNMPLTEGDSIWVGEDGRAEVHFAGGTWARLAGGTSLAIGEADGSRVLLSLEAGRLYVRDRGRLDEVVVETPSTRVVARGGAALALEVDGATTVSVLKAAARVEAGQRWRRLGAGESLTVHEDGFMEQAALDTEGAWLAWNLHRDDLIGSSSASARYLPEDLREYGHDLDDNGRWVYVRDYGYVWTPAVSLTIGWAPYREGRWLWIGGQYVWISYEPWGWVPYHYGRWLSLRGVGWCWVPPHRRAPLWRPALVAWVYTPSYAAWVPLGPRDAYDWPGGLSYLDVAISTSHLSLRLQNIRVAGSVTVVKKGAFLGGKLVHLKRAPNPFLRGGAFVGPPRWKAKATHRKDPRPRAIAKRDMYRKKGEGRTMRSHPPGQGRARVDRPVRPAPRMEKEHRRNVEMPAHPLREVKKGSRRVTKRPSRVFRHPEKERAVVQKRSSRTVQKREKERRRHENKLTRVIPREERRPEAKRPSRSRPNVEKKRPVRRPKAERPRVVERRPEAKRPSRSRPNVEKKRPVRRPGVERPRAVERRPKQESGGGKGRDARRVEASKSRKDKEAPLRGRGGLVRARGRVR